MEIREATVHDIPRIQQIYNQAILERSATCDEDVKSLEDRIDWFRQFDSAYPIYVLVTPLNGAYQTPHVAAYGCLFRYSPKSGYRYAVENSLYVDKDFRGQGLGRRMLKHLLDAAKSRSYTYIEARIFEHNRASLQLHESLGFQRVGVQRGIANLDGRWLSNVILSYHMAPQIQLEPWP